MTSPSLSTARPPVEALVLGGGLLLALAIRGVLLPAAGSPDIDQFVLWVHGLALAPLGQAYRQDISFPPVMVYILAALGAIDPAFRTITSAADPSIRVLMKLPATLADLGVAACVTYALRDRPRWAGAAAVAVLLNPAVWYVSAWWGQFESLYVLPALVAYLLAVSGRPVPAGVALGISLMTKPQALPFLVPFVAWVLARHGIRTAALGALAVVLTIAALWVPFLLDGGPAAYLRNLAAYQGGVYAVLSLRAWNLWWILQQAAGGQFAADTTRLAGPITFRVLGYVLAGLGELLVFVAVLRRPTPRALALGLACATLLAFALLTTMHERYSFPALVFLALLLPENPARWTWLALSAVVTANLVAAIPASPAIAIPLGGAIGVLGSSAMLALTAACLWLLLREPSVGRRAHTSKLTAQARAV